MGRAYLRERNQNWRGGRVVTQAGYVLIRVGKNHHLADVRGYAYEHRMVAEANLGRDLIPDEEVHHRDTDNRQNNDWSNLEVCMGRAEHFLHHRREENKATRQFPDEANLMILCACGCGQRFEQYDQYRRPRKFISGHNLGGNRCPVTGQNRRNQRG